MLIVSQRTLAELGFAEITNALAVRAATAAGQERARGLRPDKSAEATHVSHVRIEQARVIQRQNQAIPVSGADDVRSIVARAEKGAILTGEELLACGRLMRAGQEVRGFVRTWRRDAPELCAVTEGLADFAALAARIDYTLEPSGVVRDSASEALAGYRKRARSLHTEIRKRLDELLHDTTFAGYLQDNYFSVRNDRYVLPVKTSFRNQVPGIVHNASQTGLTIFVEPQLLVDISNELAIAESLAAEEERRILAELSEAVGDRALEVERAVGIIAELDLIQAAARLADEMDALPAALADPGAGFNLVRLRHPLLVLQKKRVVANDVRLEAAQRCLVISGPNAGGKTVSITAIGLCALMTHAGLPIPAGAGSAMPLYEGLRSIIGDAQDLEHDLSTFSAHLGSLRDTLAMAREGWLLLVDEIAADTDPTQGAALARAILEALVTQGARVLVTTHLDEVKALGVTDTRFVNARVGLDPETLAPNYRLELGAAGGSSAIEMAARVGLPPAIIARAREYLEGEGLLSNALSRLESSERATLEQQEALGREREQLSRERDEIAKLKGELIEQKRRAEALVRAELSAEVKARHDEVRRMMADLQAKPTIAAAQKSQKRLEELAAEDARAQARLEAETEAQARSGKEPGGAGVRGPGADAAQALKSGTWVKVVSLGKEGRILTLDGKSALVEIGTLHTRVRLADLVAVPHVPAASARGGRKGHTAHPRGIRSSDLVPAPLAQPEARCDIRGMRGDEALSTIEHFLDRCYLDGPSLVVLVHGLGTGILKQAVREALEKSPYIESFRPGDRHEGGDGVTVVQLRT